MTKRIYTLMLISLLAASCSKSETTYDESYSNTAISFATEELTADWETKGLTRGEVIGDINKDVSSILVYSFLTNQDADIVAPLINNEVATKDASDIWSFNPSYYYPLGETLDFLAYTPAAHYGWALSGNNGIFQTLDFENKSVKFTYAVPVEGRNHPDLMLATPVTGCSGTNPVGTLQFNHMLTKLTMSAKMADGTATEHLNRYKITSFTLHNIQTAASLDYSVASSDGEWYDGVYGDFIVSNVLPGGAPEDYPEEKPTLLTTGAEYQDVMNNGQAVFMIPQPIEYSIPRIGKPAIQITITDTKPTDIVQNGVTTQTYLNYRTGMMELPSYNQEGWKKGQAVDLRFEFTFDPDMVVLPMSLSVKLIPWVDQDIEVDVDPNIHAWLDTKSVKANGITYLKLYTNGEVLSAEPVSGVSKVECALTKNDGYYSIAVTAGSAGKASFKVVLDNSHDGTITKNFYINVE